MEDWIKQDFGRIKAICLKFTKNVEDREMLASITFEKIWKYRSKFRGRTIEEFRSWYYLIIRGSFYTHVNHRKYLGELEFDSKLHEMDNDEMDEKERNWRALNLEELIDDVLKPDHAVILKLQLNGLSYEEIAKAVGKTIKGVECSLTMSRKVLKTCNNKKYLLYEAA